MSMKPESAAANTVNNQPSTTTPNASWVKRTLRISLILGLVMALLLTGVVLTLPHALPWLLQRQGINFQWQNPQWHLNGLSVSQLQLTLPDGNRHPKQVQLENLRINWAWRAFPIQGLKADRLQIHWPITTKQNANEKTILALPAALLKWLPQKIQIQDIDTTLPDVGHLQGSLTLHAGAQGQPWQPNVVKSELTLKDLEGAWLDSIPIALRPQQLKVEISTHPDHQDSVNSQQLLIFQAHSEGLARIELNGTLDVQQQPDWKVTLNNGVLLAQLDKLTDLPLDTQQLQAHAYFTAHVDAKEFTISVQENSIIKAGKLFFPKTGYAEMASLELAGLKIQSRTNAPHKIAVHGPISAHLENVQIKQLHPQDWDFTGILDGQLPQLEFSGNLIGQHGLNFETQIHVQNEAVKGRIKLTDVLFKAGNPFEKTFAIWPKQLSLTSGQSNSLIDFNWPYTGTATLLINSNAHGLNGLIDKGKLKNLDLNFHAEVAVQSGRDLDATVKDGQFFIELDTITHPALSAEQVKTNIHFTGQGNTKQFSFNSSQIPNLEVRQLLLPAIGSAEHVTMQLPGLSVQGDSSTPYNTTISSQFNAHIKNLSAKPLHTQNWDYTGLISGQLPQMEITGNLIGQHGLNLDSQIHLLKNAAQGSVTLKEIFFNAGNPLQKTVQAWPELVLFNNGRLQSKINFNLPYDGPLTVSFNGNANGLNGIINRSELKNLNAKFNVTLSGQSLKVGVPTLTIEELNPGIPLASLKLTDAHYQSTLKAPLQGVADWQSVNVNLLNGRAWLNTQKLDLKQEQTLLVHVEGLELQELFRIYPAEGLAGTGIIDGELPIHIKNGAVYIEAGQLQARHPGVLQFHSDSIQALGKKNPSMRLVTDALEDFHFKLLQSALSYDQSGKLLLTIRLEGQNPDIEKGRPIHLNINLEENIPALLASIQLSGKVSEIIQKRVRERLEKR